jgi:predicted nucleotide-binding protein (sugar kinase/HSP70/actin superfamily)
MACNFPQFSILPDLAFDNAGLENLKIGLINNMAPGEIIGPALSMKMLEANIVGSILYKLYFRIKPYEVHAGQSDQILSHAKESLGEALRCGGDIKSTLQQIISEFKAVERDESGGRKPRIGIIGDLYVKYNEVVNQNVQHVVDELGGELIIPSLTEYPFHFYDADVRLFDDNPRPYKLLKTIEGRYEKLAEELIGEQKEPDFTECVELMEQYNIKHFIAGETSINIGRALYYLEHNLVDAILHINPIFCCPGVVTSSVYRKMQEDYGVPIIDIFYDGTGNPNRLLIPNLHYLVQKTTFRE